MLYYELVNDKLNYNDLYSQLIHWLWFWDILLLDTCKNFLKSGSFFEIYLIFLKFSNATVLLDNLLFLRQVLKKLFLDSSVSSGYKEIFVEIEEFRFLVIFREPFL